MISYDGAELRELLDAADADEAEPDELHGDRGPTMVDPRTLRVRFSRIKKMALSPAHYLEDCRRGDGPGETLALKIGTNADAVAFGKPIAIWDHRAKSKAGVVSKKLSPRAATNKNWVDFQAANPGKVIMTKRERQDAEGMVQALQRDSRAKALLFGSRVERDVEIKWTFMGRDCVSHLDALDPLCVTDLKTAESAHPATFTRKAVWWGYHAQLAMYVDACRLSGLGERDAYIVAVEKKRPNAVVVFQLDEDALEAGRKLWHGWFDTLLTCEASNDWPSYAQSVVPFVVPDMEPASLLIGGEEIEI